MNSAAAGNSIAIFPSPLSGAPSPAIAHVLIDDVVRGWKRQFNIDISSAVAMCPSSVLTRYCCPVSMLEFYHPCTLVADDRVYAALSEFPWYYTGDKWEHAEALRLLNRNDRILEIGCGSGAFLGSAAAHGVIATGIDHNGKAVDHARRRGLDAHVDDAILQLHSWDAIVAFQVLEHISDPLPLLRKLINQLRPGGRLLLSVPDGHSPIGALPEMQHLLDAPPHHQARWNASALQYLATMLPLRVTAMRREPLQSAHVHMSARGLLAGADDALWQRLMVKVVANAMKWCAGSTGAIKRWSGHTILAAYERTSATVNA